MRLLRKYVNTLLAEKELRGQKDKRKKHMNESLMCEYIREILVEKAIGQCYPHAVKMSRESSREEFNDLSKFKVVHGRVTDKFSGESYLHAWVEKGDMVFDWQTSQGERQDGIPKADYYGVFQPEAHEEYTAEETMTNCLKTGQSGPWNDR